MFGSLIHSWLSTQLSGAVRTGGKDATDIGGADDAGCSYVAHDAGGVDGAGGADDAGDARDSATNDTR